MLALFMTSEFLVHGYDGSSVLLVLLSFFLSFFSLLIVVLILHSVHFYYHTIKGDPFEHLGLVAIISENMCLK